MIERKIVIQSASGIDARAAATFAQETNQYKSTVWIEKENVRVNAKSIMGIISLALAKGEEITLKISGEDEQKAACELEKLMSMDFSA
jgi:catabolite repression HPr-like protein